MVSNIKWMKILITAAGNIVCTVIFRSSFSVGKKKRNKIGLINMLKTCDLKEN